LVSVASCCNEVFKIATSSAAFLNNYFMLIGTDGVYSYTFEHEKRPDCPVCGGELLELLISSEMTVERLIEVLTERQSVYVSVSFPPNRRSTALVFSDSVDAVLSLGSQIKKPSLSTSTRQIYFQAPPQLEAATRPNLEKKVSELVPNGGEVTVTASTLPFSLSLRISYN
jgi:ubiquitin-activating enzyme E1 C